ncbi:MAG: glycosyl hydrolase, partial [Planctomycetales bacterium]|nr:glycosyl hydrolase [Planctomycetales bacterium]
DVRKTLFTGWSTGDTHAGPSNLRYGLDNWFYGMVGYAGFEGEIGGQRQSFRTGFYRFRFDDPMKSETPHVEFEFLRNTNNNSWGVGISEEGELFGSTANNNPSVHLPIPNRYYERVRGWSSSVLGSIAIDPKFDPITDKVRQVDQHGRFTAAAGHALYTARQYPRTYWNRTAFVAGPTGHLVATFQIQPDGASYISRNAWNLWASDDEWSAPIMAEVGPDGNMWVIDWYNYIVQHNPTPVGYKTGKGNAYETELRDKRHGRIYRLAVNTTAPNLMPLFAAQATPEQLATVVLPHSNMFWRLHAQRRLIEGGHREVAPQLLALIADTNVDEVGLNPGAMHALWTLHGLGLLDGSHPEATEAVFAGMSHPSAGVRRNAVAVAAAIESATPKIIASGVLADNDPHVRLAALLAIADQPSSEAAAQAVMQAMADPFNLQDRWLRDAMTSAAASSALPVLKQTAASAARSPLAPEALAIIQRV